jgi:hypothetical protein
VIVADVLDRAGRRRKMRVRSAPSFGNGDAAMPLLWARRGPVWPRGPNPIAHVIRCGCHQWPSALGFAGATGWQLPVTVVTVVPRTHLAPLLPLPTNLSPQAARCST